MSNELLGTILRQLRRLESEEPEGALTDAELLDRFLRSRDQAAFEVLVWRHGPMVLRTCRRLTGCSHSGEDAFQATFLILFRKAGSIGKGSSLGAWLHRVACRAALRLKEKMDQRSQGRVAWSEAIEPEAPETCPVDDHRLDQAVDQLPERYREPFILVCLQEHSYAEAAEILGCPLGTVQSRIARARKKLQQWLARQGGAISGGLLPAMVFAQEPLAPVPAPLVRKTLSVESEPTTVSVLATETIQALGVKKAPLVAMALVLLGGLIPGAWVWQTTSSPLNAPFRPRSVGEDRPARSMPLRGAPIPEIQGEWGLVQVKGKGIEAQARSLPRASLQVKENSLILKVEDRRDIQGMILGQSGKLSNRFLLKIETAQKAMAPKKSNPLSLLNQWQAGQIVEGSYQRQGDYLWLSMADNDEKITLKWWRSRRVLVQPLGHP